MTKIKIIKNIRIKKVEHGTLIINANNDISGIINGEKKDKEENNNDSRYEYNDKNLASFKKDKEDSDDGYEEIQEE